MTKKPNLVYIFADQWRRNAVGFMGKEQVYTPNIDKFADQSVIFDNAVSCTPICSPHRAALMTGKYSLSTGVYTNCKLGLSIGLSEEETTISDLLHAASYHTGYIGKWHLDCPEQNFTKQPLSGAQDWDAYTPPGPKRHHFQYWYSYGTYDEHLTPHYWSHSDQMIQVDEWSVQHETDKAISYIEERVKEEEAFALFLSWNPPHSPFDLVPDKYRQYYAEHEMNPQPNVIIQDPFQVHTGEELPGGLERWNQYVKDYYAAITGLDEHFGKIMEVLEQYQLTDNTVVVLTSDHGELLGAHGMLAKHSWHEESIGVPFLVRYPNKLVPHRTSCILNTVDIAPSLLELLDIKHEHSFHGQSIVKYLHSEQKQQKEEINEKIAFISAYPGRLVAIEQFRKQGLNHLEYGWRGIRSTKYCYIVNKGYELGQETVKLLYDLHKDPHQLDPTIIDNNDNHPIAIEMEEQLINIMLELNDPFVNSLN